MKNFVLFFLLSTINYSAVAQKLVYPVAEKEKTSDIYLNTETITDEYQWLENLKNPKTITWLRTEADLSEPYLRKLQNRHNSFITIDRLSYFETSHPRKHGKYYFSYGIFNNNSTPALFYKTDLDVKSNLLVDPNVIDVGSRVDIQGYAVSKNSEYIAFQYNRNGVDWTEIKVIALGSGAFKSDHIKNVKFSNITWKGNGFYYSTYPRKENFDKTIGQQVFYHTIGTKQEDDKLIFERNNPALEFYFDTSSDERYFILKEINEKTGKVNVFYIDYQEPQAALKPLLVNLKFDVSILDNHNGKFIAVSSQKLNNGSVLEIDPANPLKWKAITPKFSKAVLLRAIPLKEKIITIYQTNQRPNVSVFDYAGNLLYNLELPVGTSVSGFSGNADDEEFLFSMSAYTFPPLVYSFNIKTYERKVTQKTVVNFSGDDLEMKETEAIGKDGAKIPMLLVFKKGMTLNGKNPTIISAYGGFGSIVTPSFNPGIVYFVKQGGVYAFANIRGGGDLGEDWASKGRGQYKQTSFDDFIACSEFLIKAGYTNASKLASTGGSNGGLVVAAAAIQRPDLFKAVVPKVALLDMLRFEKFTVGHFHIDEYGSVNNEESFKNLKQYSPYHNIKPDINYPAMLLMTSENDDRVPPFHSYKFAAQLQNRPAQKNPILLRVEKNAGHYGAATINSEVREAADMYGFIWEMLNQ